jgi:GAF domain-containing protein/CheY-like chemotaxis protein
MVIADIESNASALVENILRPAGLQAWREGEETPVVDLLIVDVTQLMGDPLAGLRSKRAAGDDTPALILAARFPQSRLRDFFRLGVADVLMKPYRPQELIDAINELVETRSKESDTEALSRKLESSREHVRQRSEEIRLLGDIGRTVVNLGDLDQILTRVTEAAAFVTDAEEANIYLVEPNSDELVLRASKQAGQSHATLQRLRVEDTVVGQVYRTGQSVLRQPSLEGGPVKIQTGFLVRSLINVPIRLKNSVTGVLGVYNRMASRPFNEHQLTLLTALADWTGVALEHTQLLDQTKKVVTGELLPEKGLPFLEKPIQDALERVDKLLEEDQASFSAQQLANLEGLKLSLLRGLAQTKPHAKAPDESEMIDLTEILQEVIDTWKPNADEHGIELIFGPSLPISPLPGERLPVYQILENLVSAGINRTPEGRVVCNLHRFDVEAGEADGFSPPDHISLEDGVWLAVTIADSSPGLPADVIQALSSEEPNPSLGREGPGLSMGEIRMIAQSIGAVIWYDQTPAGTTVIFAFQVL